MLENDIIEQIGDLPTLPTVASRINSEMQKESLTAKSLGRIISDDTALAAKILRLSNSAFYGQSRQVNDIDKAVMILGFNTIKSLAMSISIFSLFEKHIDTAIDVEGMWRHSLGCAVASKILIEKTEKNLGDEAFLFGVIHDIGKVVFINAKFDEFEKAIEFGRSNGVSGSEAEVEKIGFSHQKIGGLLLDHWNFPDDMIAGVKMHHNLEASLKNLSPETAALVRSVSVGNQMAKALSLGSSSDPKRQAIPENLWNVLGVKRDELSSLGEHIKGEYVKLMEAWGV